jgi:hypothetical protein
MNKWMTEWLTEQTKKRAASKQTNKQTIEYCKHNQLLKLASQRASKQAGILRMCLPEATLIQTAYPRIALPLQTLDMMIDARST